MQMRRMRPAPLCSAARPGALRKLRCVHLDARATEMLLRSAQPRSRKSSPKRNLSVCVSFAQWVGNAFPSVSWACARACLVVAFAQVCLLG